MILALTLLVAAPQGADWQFVAPGPGAPQEHPPARALPLFDAPPDGVTEAAVYRGKRRRYAQVRYGAPGSTRIAVVIDDLGDGKVDLYVDADRDRRIASSDRVAGAGPSWRLPLKLARADDAPTGYTVRPAVLRLDTHSLAFAPVGYVEGTARLGDRDVRVRRVDADGNDSFCDGRDRLLIDLDGDGRFDPVDEVFLYAPVLMIAEQRWVVREAKDGAWTGRVGFARLEGTGTVQLIAEETVQKAVRALRVTLQSKDGMTVGIDALARKQEVPVGVYRVVTVDVSLDDAAGGAPWGFVFSTDGPAKRWFDVGKDKAVDIAPLTGLTFEAGAKSDVAAAGKSLLLQPRLLTPDGLLINSCWRGEHTGFGHVGPHASIALRTPDGAQLDTTTSGFA